MDAEKVRNKGGRPPGTGGRPTGSPKITPALITEITGCIRAGRPVKACCEAVGISVSEHDQWMKKGEVAVHISYVNYYQQVRASKAAGEIDLIDKLHDHSVHSWQAATRLLEILDPEEYSQDVKMRVSGKIESEVTHRIEIPAGETKKLLDSLRKFAPNAQIGGTDFDVIDAEVVEPLELEAASSEVQEIA